jgi:hypothetical protein
VETMGIKRCAHDKLKYDCADCNPCPHGKVKRKCVDCNGCLHGKASGKTAAWTATRARMES